MTEELNIFTSNADKEVVLTFEGKEIRIKVRELSWSEKNTILSQCFTYNSDSSVSFNLDKYMKLVLSRIIVSAPWGETNQIFLTKIKPAFGAMLEKLVPKAFEEGEVPDFFAGGQKA